MKQEYLWNEILAYAYFFFLLHNTVIDGLFFHLNFFLESNHLFFCLYSLAAGLFISTSAYSENLPGSLPWNCFAPGKALRRFDTSTVRMRALTRWACTESSPNQEEKAGTRLPCWKLTEPKPPKWLPLVHHLPACTCFSHFIKKEKERELLIRNQPFTGFPHFLSAPNYFLIVPSWSKALLNKFYIVVKELGKAF